MTRRTSAVPTSLWAAVATLALSGPAAARPDVGVQAADFLARAQGWYQGPVPTDRGVRSRIVRNGWEWRRGRGDGAPNVTGIVAGALLDAYERHGDGRYLDRALLYGMTLRNDFRDFRSLTIPYRPDVAFLARLSDLTGDPDYREVALVWFGNLTRISPTGAAEVERTLLLRDGRDRSLVGWDVAFSIHAAIGVGDVAYAAELADAVWARRKRWQAPMGARDSWDAMSRAALASAFMALDADRYGAAADALVAALLAAQRPDGSWAGSTQTTAYALQALSGAGAGDPATEAGARRAARWLAKGLGPDGAWPASAADPARNVEVQAEALAAYLAYLRRG